MNNKVFCDLDGTLINSDLEAQFVKFLMNNKKLSIFNYLVSVISIPVNSISKKFDKGDKFKAWSVFRSSDSIDDLFSEFVKNYTHKICVNKIVLNLLREYKKKQYTIILLTASNFHLVKRFIDLRNMNDLIDEIIGSKLNDRNFLVKIMPYGKQKCKYLSGDNMVGIANEYADRFYLSRCNTSYVLSKDKRLLKLANEKGWIIL